LPFILSWTHQFVSFLKDGEAGQEEAFIHSFIHASFLMGSGKKEEELLSF
jgi:hypothetical protein